MDTRAETDSGNLIFVDQLLWSQLGNAKSVVEFCRAWLVLQCSMLKGVKCAVVVLRQDGSDDYKPVAFWPEQDALLPGVMHLAEETLTLAKSQIDQNDEVLAVAYPLGQPGNNVGVVAIGVEPTANASELLRQLQWGSAWLDMHMRRTAIGDEQQITDRLITVLDLIATSLSHERFLDAARAVVTELAVLLECDRVSLGFVKSGFADIVAVSHSSQIGGHMNLVRAIGNAMDEAIDQHSVIAVPAAAKSDYFVSREHEKLSGLVGGSAILSVPLLSAGEFCGAMTLERHVEIGFDDTTIELCKSVGIAIGPMLDSKRREDRSIFVKIAAAAGTAVRRVLGPGYLLRKLVAIVMLLFVGLSIGLTGEYRVSATSRVEGAERRVISAPIEGYIASAAVRPGDIVDAGKLLFEFDDRDLRLERVQVSSERAQMAARLQDAMAKRERANVQIINAQIEQADAHLALLDEQIQRTKVVAPFDGLIISGDLSQSLGAAVERGEVLYELAPLNRYRVVLEVDEHDIASVLPTQQGSLLLAALPDQPLALEVTRLTSVASSAEGVNYFRVEANLKDAPVGVRPGMEGVGKIDIEERRLIWIWTHQLSRWLKLAFWSWTP